MTSTQGHDVLGEIAGIGMIPVLSVAEKAWARPLADALEAGGLPLMEVMFRTAAAAEVIGTIARECPDFLVGAGTVLSVEQARQAVDCGARFLVAPGFNPRVAAWAVEKGVPYVPGTVTPTEVEAARELGLNVLKYFPAVQMGGVPGMRLLSGPYPDVRWVPTGDLTRDLAREYLGFEKVAAAGGDFMLSYADIHACRWENITHSTAATLSEYFAFSAEPGSVVFPAELTAACGLPEGTAGAALSCRDPERACRYLRRRGCRFELGDTVCDALGRWQQTVLTGKAGSVLLKAYSPD